MSSQAYYAQGPPPPQQQYYAAPSQGMYPPPQQVGHAIQSTGVAHLVFADELSTRTAAAAGAEEGSGVFGYVSCDLVLLLALRGDVRVLL
jgi:hypothetical protein